MRLLMYILSILISCNLLAGMTYHVNNSSPECENYFEVSDCDGSSNDPGNGYPDTPYCCIQNAINKIEASEDDCIFSAYTDCIDDWECDVDVDCTDGQTMENCPFTCGYCDEVGVEQLNFARVCTVLVVSGITYAEELTIIKDMVIISKAAADGYWLEADDIDEFINQGLPTIAPPPSDDECVSSTITIRPDPEDVQICTNPDVCTSFTPAFKVHPHVKINGFIIESGKGSGIIDGVTGQYLRVGGAIFAYLSVPQVNNCIFKGGDENQLGNLIYYTPDPDDIIYPAAKPGIERNECSFDDNSFGAINWPDTWEINLSQNSYDYDCDDTDEDGNCDVHSEGSIDRPLALPQIFINGFTNNTVDLTSCLFTVYNTDDATTGVSEYWVKGRIKEGEKVEFIFSGSATKNSPMIADTITVIPNLLGGDDCNDSDECKTIHAALARIIPSPNSPKIIQLLSDSTYSVNTAIPIIDGISIIGTSDGDSKPKLKSTGADRLFICQDMQNQIVTYRNLEISNGKAPKRIIIKTIFRIISTMGI